MNDQTILFTERLALRRFTLADAVDIKRLAGCRDIAATTLSIPHPYEDGVAEKWIESHQKGFQDGTLVDLAITRRPHKFVMGAVGLAINTEHNHAELGYWVGKPYWKQGYATEAARELVRYGFEVIGLNRIHSHHFASNPASGCVMRKAGLTHEGTLRQHICKWDEYHDVQMYGICREDHRKGRD